MSINAVKIASELIVLADTARELTSPAVYAERVQQAKELITALMRERGVSPLAAALELWKAVPEKHRTCCMWLAAAVVEMTT